MKYNGHGVFTDTDAKYDGQFKDGATIGHGVFTDTDGSTYEGEFTAGFSFDGHGVYTWADGRKYDGDLEDDKQNGVFTDIDGSTYDGD